MEPATSSFLAADGVEIVFDTSRPDGEAVGVPVLLHHGFASSVATNWVNTGVVRALTDRRRVVVALDARGHGRSGKPRDSASYGHGVMSRDVSTLLDHLGMTDAGSVDLVGYSMGAYVAAITASRAESAEPRLRSVVIGGIGVPAMRPRALDRSAIADALEADDPRSVTDRSARQFRRFADATGSDRLALAAAMRAPFEPLADLDRIRVPALVLVGRSDELATSPELLAQAIPGARLVLTDGDHLRAPGRPDFRTAIAEFLDTVDAAAYVLRTRP